MPLSSEARRTILAFALGALGLAQMAGDLLGMPTLRGIAAATAASPAPRVFSTVRGLETFSSRFVFLWEDSTGAEQRLDLTPERSARIRGPYNRRNVYGAILAYGPIFSTDDTMRPMFESAVRHAMCGDAPLLRELGIEPAAARSGLRVVVEPRPDTPAGNLPLELRPECPR